MVDEIAAFIGKIIICELRRLFGLKLVFLQVLNFVIRLERCFNVCKIKSSKMVIQKKGKYKVSKRSFGHYLIIHILICLSK